MKMFYSHYDKNAGGRAGKILAFHLLETAEATRSYILAVPDAVDEKHELADLAFIIGLAHDFGKYTTFFQDYLLNGVDHGDKKNHSLISALWSMYVLQQKWHGKGIDQPTAMLLGFACIRHHHGDLASIDDALRQFRQFQRLDLQDMMDVSPRRALKTLFDCQLPDIVENAEAIQNDWRERNLDLPAINDFAAAAQTQNSDFWKAFKKA